MEATIVHWGNIGDNGKEYGNSYIKMGYIGFAASWSRTRDFHIHLVASSGLRCRAHRF